jgi:hypothetical protein
MTRSLPVKDSTFNLKPATSSENWYVFDLETDGLYDDVTEIFCIVLYDVARKQTLSFGPSDVDRALELIRNADALIGHNILFYDIPVLEKLYPNFFTKKPHVIDTLVATRLLWPKEKLYDLDCNHYANVPPGLRGTAGLKAWGYRLSDNKIDFKDFSQYSAEMLVYCQQDVNVTTKLYEVIERQNIKQSAYRLEHDFAQAIERQIRSGFPFDIDECLNLVDELECKKQELELKLKEIFPPIQHEEWKNSTLVPDSNSLTVSLPSMDGNLSTEPRKVTQSLTTMCLRPFHILRLNLLLSTCYLRNGSVKSKMVRTAGSSWFPQTDICTVMWSPMDASPGDVAIEIPTRHKSLLFILLTVKNVVLYFMLLMIGCLSVLMLKLWSLGV